MRAIGNLLWFVLGGVFMGLAWWLLGIIAFITIIGIPWGRACFTIGNFCFFPFGREAVSRRDLHQKTDLGTGPLGLIGNIIGSSLPACGWLSAMSSPPSPAS